MRRNRVWNWQKDGGAEMRPAIDGDNSAGYGSTQEKLAASLMSPLPLYLACLG